MFTFLAGKGIRRRLKRVGAALRPGLPKLFLRLATWAIVAVGAPFIAAYVAVLLTDPTLALQLLASVALTSAILIYFLQAVARMSKTLPKTSVLSVATVGAPVLAPEDAARVAHHEAAHAVVALALDLAAVSATIIPTADAQGVVAYILPEGRPLADNLYACIVVDMAGQAVDVAQGFHDEGSFEDLKQAQLHALYLLSSGLRPSNYSGALTTDEIIATARLQADAIIQEHWSTYKRIAQALETEHKLPPSRLLEIASGL